MLQNIPAPSLLLGLLRFHQIEQLLFRVDLKLGIENAAHASTRTARTACLAATTRALPSALPLAPACTRATSSTSIGAKPRNFTFCDTPLSTPPIQEKTNPQVGLFFQCMQMGLARLALPQIASAAHGFDVLGNLGAELGAQAAHMHIDRATAAVIIEAPHLGEQHLARVNSSRVRD